MAVLRSLLGMTVVVSIAAGATVAPPAAAAPVDIGQACPAAEVPETDFADIDAEDPHRQSVACAAWWQIAVGTGADAFSPRKAVTRAQMATFIARAIEQSSGVLPAAVESDAGWFEMDPAAPHARNVARLAAAGIVSGVSSERYKPNAPVTRAQMATFLARAYAARTGQMPPEGADHFRDDAGDPHEANINRVATLGLASGLAPGEYSPKAAVRRSQMASFLVRLLSVLVGEGVAPVLPTTRVESSTGSVEVSPAAVAPSEVWASLTQPLSRPAAVTVSESTAELTVPVPAGAAVDPDLLAVGRYDAATASWSVVPARYDADAHAMVIQSQEVAAAGFQARQALSEESSAPSLIELVQFNLAETRDAITDRFAAWSQPVRDINAPAGCDPTHDRITAAVADVAGPPVRACVEGSENNATLKLRSQRHFALVFDLREGMTWTGTEGGSQSAQLWEAVQRGLAKAGYPSHVVVPADGTARVSVDVARLPMTVHVEPDAKTIAVDLLVNVIAPLYAAGNVSKEAALGLVECATETVSKLSDDSLVPEVAAAAALRECAIASGARLPAKVISAIDGVAQAAADIRGYASYMSGLSDGRHELDVTVDWAAPPAVDAATAKGKIIRADNGTAYYVDKTGYRHWLPDGGVFECHGGWANTIDGVAWSDIHRIPEAEHAKCFDAGPGDIIAHPDGDSYVLVQAEYALTRRWIPTAGAYVCARAEGRRAVSVARYHVEEIAPGDNLPAANCIVRRPDSTSYFVNNEGLREWIPDSPTWDCELGRGVPVRDASAEFVNGISETGWHFCYHKPNFHGKVLRHIDGHDAHYIHPDNTRTWIPDGPTYECRQRQGKAVVETRWREYIDGFHNSGWDYCYDIETMKNKIISHPDGDSHYVDGAGVRHWIPNGDIYWCLRNRGIAAVDVRWREYIEHTPKGDWAAC